MSDENSSLRYQAAYRRHLPHIQPPEARFFITFRLAGSLPAAFIDRLRNEREVRRISLEKQLTGPELAKALLNEERDYFRQLEQHLDRAVDGPKWLGDTPVAQVVTNTLQWIDGRKAEVHAYCLMPNHVHLVMTPLRSADGTSFALPAIMHSIKGYSATEANRLLNRRGTFWQPESYDHVIRDPKEYSRIVRYVLNNPVKAGLVQEWTDWPWSYWNHSS